MGVYYFFLIVSFLFLQDTILLCCECDTTVHLACLNPPLVNLPENINWVCDECRANDSAENKTPIKDCSSDEGKMENNKSLAASPAPFPSTSSAAPGGMINYGPWVFGTRQLELKGPPFEWDSLPSPDPEIPDAAAWTPEEVHNYFSSLGFQEQATKFRQNVSNSIR